MSNSLVPIVDNFPILSGEYEVDVADVISELAVGKVVIERGWARLYLMWKSKIYKEAMRAGNVCVECGEEGIGDICQLCGGQMEEGEIQEFPTLEAFISHISEYTGKSRMTIFNRLRVYRVLCDERGIDPQKVFALSVLSPGAAVSLSRAEDETSTPIDGSWAKTIDQCLSFDNTSELLKFIRHEILNKPLILCEWSQNKLVVYRETYPTDGDVVVEKFEIDPRGLSDWPDDMVEWLFSKLKIKT